MEKLKTFFKKWKTPITFIIIAICFVLSNMPYSLELTLIQLALMLVLVPITYYNIKGFIQDIKKFNQIRKNEKN